MRSIPSRRSLLAVALVLSVLGASLAGGQTADPEWADDLFTDLESWTVDYNTNVDELTPLEKRLLGGQGVALRIRDADGREATYWFETDSEARITSLERSAESQTVTLRLATTKTVVDRIVAASDPVEAAREALFAGEIGVKKLFVVFGMTVAVGAVEVVAGTVGFVVGAVVLAKAGLGSVISVPKAAASRLVGRGKWVLRTFRATPAPIRGFLADVLMAVSVLDLMGVNVKGRIRAIGRTLALPFVWLGNARRRSPPEEEGVPDREQ